MRIIKGELEYLIENAPEKGRNDYIKVILTDKLEVFDPIGKLRTIYPNIMNIEFEIKKHNTGDLEQSRNNIVNKNPKEIFRDFYEIQNGEQLTENQFSILDKLFSEVERWNQ